MPQSHTSNQERELLVGDATKMRYFAYALDTILAVVFTMAVGMNLDVLDVMNPMVRGFLGFVLFFAYFFLFEGATGQTPGKMYLGLVVRSQDGGRCSWLQAFVRSILRFLETNPLLFGGAPAAICVVVTKRKQRIADLLAGTVVVSKRQLRDRVIEHNESRVTCDGCGEELEIGQSPCPVCGATISGANE